MLQVKRSRRVATALVAAAGIAAAVVPASAQALNVTDACRQNVTANNSQINVDTSADAPASVAPGAAITLTNLKQKANIPGSIFVAGYNLGLGNEGSNSVPAKVFTYIAATNATPAEQKSSIEDVIVTYVITDPDHNPGTGDESASDGQIDVTYDDMTFTAGASGPATFRQATKTPLVTSPEGSEVGGLVIRALVGGFFKVRFACSPGTVTGPDPGTVAFIDPAPPFASTAIAAAAPSCFGVDGATLTEVSTPDGPAYVSSGVTVSSAGGENTFTGTNGPDTIIGTSGRDLVNGLDGADKICTLDGKDRPAGGKAGDQIDGGAGPDGVFGQPGDDTLLGGTGNDAITGQQGDDTLDGGADTDTCNGGVGTDAGANCETLSNVP